MELHRVHKPPIAHGFWQGGRLTRSCYPLVLIVANGCGYTQGPFWLPWRSALVIKLKTTLPLLPLNYAFVVAAKTRIQCCLCNCRWNFAISYGWKPHDIWQRSRLAEESRSRRFKHTASLQLLYTVGGNQARLDGTKFEISPSDHASNLAWLPLTVYSNYSEAVCLAARTLLLADLKFFWQAHGIYAGWCTWLVITKIAVLRGGGTPKVGYPVERDGDFWVWINLLKLNKGPERHWHLMIMTRLA